MIDGTDTRTAATTTASQQQPHAYIITRTAAADSDLFDWHTNAKGYLIHFEREIFCATFGMKLAHAAAPTGAGSHLWGRPSGFSWPEKQPKKILA